MEVGLDENNGTNLLWTQRTKKMELLGSLRFASDLWTFTEAKNKETALKLHWMKNKKKKKKKKKKECDCLKGPIPHISE